MFFCTYLSFKYRIWCRARNPGTIPNSTFLGERHTYNEHIIYIPNIPIRGAVISLHGGPESCEYDEIRYSGIYRDLLHQGIIILVLNYYGSSNYGFHYRSTPWNDWLKSYSEELNNAINFLKCNFNVIESQITVYGVSFGGALALAAPMVAPNINAVIAVAPLINLENHVNKLQYNHPNMVQWFERRFLNDNNKKMFTEQFYLRNTEIPVTIIQGDSDEIFNFEDALNLVTKAKEKGINWLLKLEVYLPITTSIICKFQDPTASLCSSELRFNLS